jgi:hypothetical protein
MMEQPGALTVEPESYADASGAGGADLDDDILVMNEVQRAMSQMGLGTMQ